MHEAPAQKTLLFTVLRLSPFAEQKRGIIVNQSKTRLASIVLILEGVEN